MSVDPKVQILEIEREIKKLEDNILLKRRKIKELESTIERSNNGLSTEEIVRYSRQMLVPNVGFAGQVALKCSKVLIVGIGGLGCPAALYLSSAGIGQLTLLDYDDVELSNLHRQILHAQRDLNNPKVDSANEKLSSINLNVEIIPMKVHANSDSLLELVTKNKYNVIIDGSDNVATRYLLNDICVMHGIPLVSGSALQMEGQLTVYNHNGGPCYRCIFPVPPPAYTVTNCGDGGVLGPVPGVIGVLQALETIKILTKMSDVLSGRLLLFDASSTTFRNVKLRPRNLKCDVCGENPTVRSLIDYEQFCGASAHDKVINIDIVHSEQQYDVRDFSQIDENALVIDVRPELEYNICKLPNTVNYPYGKAYRNPDTLREFLQSKAEEGIKKAYFICRRGNDSQRTLALLNDRIDLNMELFNIKGGLHAYAKYVDSSFPIY